jgi:hypothetical protein
MALTNDGRGRMADPESRRRRGRLAANARHHPDRPDLTVEDRQHVKAATAERYIRRLVDTFPPLTDQQRARLATLLAGGGDPDDGPAT